MENFIVSARKYRPQTFESVVGQRHITSTLENAIANNHLAQALLFCGPRGVGKTTCARILAKKINEENGIDAENFDLNIFELDAASNNSVDDIRRLTDQVRIPPQVGKFRVFIIDEVHMLSQAAFNAFLKTLEEPPAHAIFILATTEKHKIIPTILSRCQIFDFKRIRVEDIAQHLGWVAEQEGVTAEPQALHVIAQKADGALRDSLSIFDRIISYSGNQLTYQQAIENLNILDYDYYFKTLDSVLAGNHSDLFLLFDEILEKGFDGHHFLLGLGGHLRDLLVAQDPRTTQLLEVGETVVERYVTQAKSFSISFLVHALDKINKADAQYKGSNNPRLLVEITLTQLVSMAHPTAEGEKKNTSPSVANQTSVATPTQAAAPTAQQTAPAAAPPPAFTSTPANPSATQTQTKSEVPSEPQSQPEPQSPPPPQAEANIVSSSESAPAEPKPEVVSQRMEDLKTSAPRRDRSQRRRGSGISISSLDNPIPKKEEEKKTEESDQPINIADQKPFTLDDLIAKWTEFAEMHNDNKHIYNTLIKNKPVLINDTDLVLTLDNNTQEHYLSEIKTELLGHVRKGLQNYAISLQVEITAKEEVKSLYTPDEKYKHMSEVNPNIVDLKKRLDLDLE
ncbi:MAG: DNA polymerase III subunit gamma/tau [Schleiferiaceae bacterium]